MLEFAVYGLIAIVAIFIVVRFALGYFFPNDT